MKDQFLAGRLYVGSLNHSTTKDDIQREFGKFGHLVDIWMARNPPGFAFVEFETAGQAEAALKELNGRTFLGNRIMVEPSRAQNGRGGRGGGRGGGGGGGGGRYDGRRDGDRGRTGGPTRSPRGQYRDYPPSDYGRSSDFGRGGGDFGRGGGGGYRDDNRGSRYSDSYSYGESAYRSRSPIRRRSPAFAAPPPSRGRDYGGRDYGGGRDIGSRDMGGRDYARREPRRDYEREPRDYAPGPSASYGGGRPERSPYDSRGSDRGYDRGGFDHGGYDRGSRRSPPRR